MANAKPRNLDSMKCVDCGIKYASFGYQQDGKRQWCAACSRDHEGAINIGQKLCEDCRRSGASFGIACVYYP